MKTNTYLEKFFRSSYSHHFRVLSLCLWTLSNQRTFLKAKVFTTVYVLSNETVREEVTTKNLILCLKAFNTDSWHWDQSSLRPYDWRLDSWYIGVAIWALNWASLSFIKVGNKNKMFCYKQKPQISDFFKTLALFSRLSRIFLISRLFPVCQTLYELCMKKLETYITLMDAVWK